MEMLTADEASRMLGVSRRQLSRFVQSGKLLQREDLYDPNEVAELKELLKKKPSLTEVAILAQRAHMEAFRARRELELLKEILGINLPHLSLDEEAVRALHIQAEDSILSQHVYTAKEMVDWSRIFLAIGEEYFEAITLYTKLGEPWWTYIELAEKMAKSTSQQKMHTDLELKMAYDYLATARPHLRDTAFSRSAQVLGRQAAFRMFPEMKGRGHQSVLQAMSAIESAKQRKDQG